jgi:hypothetical protein
LNPHSGGKKKRKSLCFLLFYNLNLRPLPKTGQVASQKLGTQHTGGFAKTWDSKSTKSKRSDADNKYPTTKHHVFYYINSTSFDKFYFWQNNGHAPPPVPLPEQQALAEMVGVDGETSSFIVTIAYPPRALRRSIFVRSRGYAINPDSRELLVFKGLLQNSFLPGTPLPYYPNLDSPIYLAMTFRMKRPNYHFINSNRANKIRPAYATAIPKKKDLDNMVKFVMDAANGIIYPDDRQVTYILANKFYHEDTSSIGSITVAANVVH